MKDYPNFFAVIPAHVRYDKSLCSDAKLLYGEVAALCNVKGYCWARNEYFSNLYGVSDRTVLRWLTSLKAAGAISIEYKFKDGTKEIESRKIRITPPDSPQKISYAGNAAGPAGEDPPEPVESANPQETAVKNAGAGNVPEQAAPEATVKNAGAGNVSENPAPEPPALSSSISPDVVTDLSGRGDISVGGVVTFLSGRGDKFVRDNNINSNNINLNTSSSSTPPNSPESGTAPDVVTNLSPRLDNHQVTEDTHKTEEDPFLKLSAKIKEDLSALDNSLIFDRSFYPRAARFIQKYKLPHSDYIKYLFLSCKKNKPKNMPNYFYSLFFQNQFVELFLARQAAASPPPPKTLSCPVCASSVLSNEKTCPSCALDLADFQNSGAIYEKRALLNMSPALKQNYQRELQEASSGSLFSSFGKIREIKFKYGLLPLGTIYV